MIYQRKMRFYVESRSFHSRFQVVSLEIPVPDPPFVKNRFFKPRENPEKVQENPGKLQEKSMYIFGEVRKVSHGAGFAEFSGVFEK